MDDTMDFIEILSSTYDKLRNKEMVNLFWKEILQGVKSEDHIDDIIQYSFHHPIDTEAYLELLNEMFSKLDKQKLRTIDGYLKAYIITFLYYCTNYTNNSITPNTRVLASCLYLKLISHPDLGTIFYEKNMYKLQIIHLVSVVKGKLVPESVVQYYVKQVKKCTRMDLSEPMLNVTANAITSVLMISNRKMVDDIKKVDPLPLYCLNTLKQMIMEEDNGNRLKCIFGSLFRSLKSSVIETMHDQAQAFSIICVSVDLLQQELTIEKFQYALDGFCRVWGQEDFTHYDRAIDIMNCFKEEHYKDLLKRMVSYTQSRNHKRFLKRVMHLLVAILKNLPPYQMDKIEVIYSCALRNVLLQIVNEDVTIATQAIEVLTSVCLMKDNILLRLIFSQIQITNKFINISIEALLYSFNEIVDAKWGTSPKNQNLLVIMAKFLAHTRNVDCDLVEKTLKLITKDCTPFTLKPSLPILHKLICVMALKEEIQIAEVVFRIIFRMALHQDSASDDYLDHLFTALLYPSHIDGITYNPKYYCSILFSSDFEYETFFVKCQKKISREHVSSVIDNLNHAEPGGAVLLCCLLKFCRYDESTALATFFVDNFKEISINEIMGPLSRAFIYILDQKALVAEDIPRLDVLQGLLIDSLFEQAVLIPCMKPAYELFKKIRQMLRIDPNNYIPSQLHQIVSRKATSRLIRVRYLDRGELDMTPTILLQEIIDSSIIMYLNEVCLLVRKLPDDSLIQLIESYIDTEEQAKALQHRHPELFVQVITLFTTVAMMCKRKVPLALKYLRELIKDEKEPYKLIAFKLLFTLSQEITHEYGEILVFAAREIAAAGPCLTKICVVALEELVHKDYLKLCSESFFKLVFSLGSDHHTIFVQELLKKRFIGSNHNDIAQFYVHTIIYIHSYQEFKNYPIAQTFQQDLANIRLKLNNSKDICPFLFGSLPIQKKMNVWCEIATILDEVIQGRCKTGTNFYNILNELIETYKFMNADIIRSTYYAEICQLIENQIVKFDESNEMESYYTEFEQEIRKCTLTLLKLLFLEDEQLADHIQITLFDSVIHWIDFVKAEIVHYVHVDKGKEYGHYFKKLLQYYKRNKNKFIKPKSFSLET